MEKDALTPLERRLVECAAKGEELDCAPNGGVTEGELDEIKDWDEREIRAEVIVALCTGEEPDWSVHPRRGYRLRGAKIVGRIAALCTGEVPGWSVHPRVGLRLRGAYVVGLLDLSRAQLSQCPLAFHTCRFEELVSLYQATTADVTFASCGLPGLFGDQLNSSGLLALIKTHLDRLWLRDAHFRRSVWLIGAHLFALSADRLNAANVLLTDNTHVEGEVRLPRAQISADLDCDDAHLVNPDGYALAAEGLNAANVFLRRAQVKGKASLLRAKISGVLNCDDAHLSNPGGDALSAEGLNVASVFMRRAKVKGEVCLLAAKVSNQLICNDARLCNPDGYALAADGLSAADVFLQHACVEGQVNLTRAKINGHLECDDAHLSNRDGYALAAEGLNAANVFLRNNAHVEGGVFLLAAQISGQLDCSDAHLSNPGGKALSADRLNTPIVFLDDAHIKGAVYLEDAQIGTLFHRGGAHLSNLGGIALSGAGLNATNVILSNVQVEGQVRLSRAKISGRLAFSDGTKLHNPNSVALSARGCHIGGTLYFHLAARAVGKVDLAYAQVGALDDKLASWPETFNLMGCSYRALAAKNRDPSQRLKWWLSGSAPFSPDVYSQLAEVYRRSGEEGHAQKVAIEREKQRARQPDLSWGVRVWRRFLGFTVAYGYKPGQALGLFMAFLAVGGLYFAQSSAEGAMIPTRHSIAVPHSAAEACQNYPCFSPLLYSLDALVPIIDFHQEIYWAPATNRPWGWVNMVLTTFLMLVGWLLITAIVASIGSLWRRE